MSPVFARREANVVLLLRWKESVWAEFSEVVQMAWCSVAIKLAIATEVS